MASSNAARQCWIDFTVGIIKIIEALHTPEVKALLDQSAVSICRFVDVWSSGKAKQIWFDLSATLWALVEVGSDPLVVMTLAEGCAQICFALEEERGSLKQWREKDSAARRRKERDARQMEMYPKDGEMVSGREGVEKALMHTLGHAENEENTGVIKSGPPSVIVQNNQLHEDSDRDGPTQTPTLDPVVSAEQDGESEITAEEIEDLQLQEKSSNDEQWISLDTGGQKITYEHGDDDSTPDVASQPDNNDDQPDLSDVFQESIMQFHRRLNEVLDETRKGSKLSDVIEKKLMKENRPKKNGQDETTDRQVTQNGTPTSPALMFRALQVNRWKIIIVAAICFAATIVMSWFALGCYGFYVIFLRGRQQIHVQSSPLTSQLERSQMQPIIIQVMVGENEASDKSGSSSNFASMNLDDWRKMSRDVETAIRKQIDGNDEL
jgi:hypothetical protein